MRVLPTLQFTNGFTLTVEPTGEELVIGGVPVPKAEVPELITHLRQHLNGKVKHTRCSPVLGKAELCLTGKKLSAGKGTKAHRAYVACRVFLPKGRILTKRVLVAKVAKKTRLTQKEAGYTISALIHHYRVLEVVS